LIEWPERFVKSINLNPDITIDFKVLNEKERNIFVNIL
jgi:tRNA A37 threonylcarbamoyladenosine biosynthesis protein TsaE